MKKFVVFMLLTSYTFADCGQMLIEKNKKTATPESLDSRITLQIVSAANRIAGESLWKAAPDVSKVEENLYKSDFRHGQQSLTVFYNKAAEVQGYIQTKNKKTTHWCIKE